MAQDTHRLGPFDLLLLVRTLGRRHFEGVLDLEDAAAERRTRVFFVAGSPAWCRTDDLLYSFAAHALRRRIAPLPTLRVLLRQAEEHGQRIEDVLVGQGILDAQSLLRVKTVLSDEVFDLAMAAATLDYRVLWTRTVLGSGAAPTLDPWSSFFRVVASGANVDFQRAYVKSRRIRRLRPTPQLHAMLPQVVEAFGAVARDVVQRAVDGATVGGILEASEEESAVTPPIFALIYSRLVSCKEGADPEASFPGLERPAPPAAAPQAAAPHAAAPQAAAPQAAAPQAAANELLVFDFDGVGPPAALPAASPAAPTAAFAAPVTAQADAALAAGLDVTRGATLGLSLDGEQATAAPAPETDDAWAMSIAVAEGEGPPERGDPSVENALSEMLLKLQKANAYRALDVAKEATFSQIREAHLRLKRKYDESQFRTFVLGRHGFTMLGEIGALLDRALRTLTDPKLRPGHDKKVGIGDGTLSEDLKGAFRAEAAFATGLRHLKALDWDSATMAFRTAIELFPKDAAYHAHYAWSLSRAYRAGTVSEPDTMDKVWNQLEHALELNPRLQAANLFRGRLAKDFGDPDAAMDAWQKVLSSQPDHPEALNEMRLLRESGHRRKEKKPAKGGVLGGIFRRSTLRK